MKICKRCKEEKETNKFHNTKYNTPTSWCKKCFSNYAMARQNPEKWKEYLKESWTKPRMIFSHKKANAKKEEILFNITKDQFISWYMAQKLQCHYCGLRPEDFKTTLDKYLTKKVNLGLDRVDNSKGYEIENIVLCCNRCNSIKGEFFTHDEMKVIGHKFIRLKWVAHGIYFK